MTLYFKKFRFSEILFLLLLHEINSTVFVAEQEDYVRVSPFLLRCNDLKFLLGKYQRRKFSILFHGKNGWMEESRRDLSDSL